MKNAVVVQLHVVRLFKLIRQVAPQQLAKHIDKVTDNGHLIIFSDFILVVTNLCIHV